ncbi:DUF2752 domain-containing protein [uncultured Corynebacterium sp.]|uniref:DUF2752 domain-containing protein n=1 Tax=uncultured Corynebacterium sp. TaxID=159447 RepID=UPI0025F3C710|nr:DUF2752 domain-containing protein [uncultured Corynebacterium sp.]
MRSGVGGPAGSSASTKLLPLAVGAASVCACCAIAATDPQTPGGVIPECPTKALFGFNCPGCGSMRMIQSLVQGDFGAALHYNAVGILAVILLIWSWLAWTARSWGKRIPNWEHFRHAPMVVGIVIGLWFIARILPFSPFIELRV